MAVGDVINGISAVGTNFTYQPAAGVEVMVTSLFGTDETTANKFRLTDGTLKAALPNFETSVSNVKIMINNTNYLTINLITNKVTGFTGIQIK